ncbi:MAG: hypothetical protein JRI97_06785 [Deltaproteobacteria bacterium]|nr:hypothetical protein [Deltaproteobacteria bacterium]
MAEYRYFVSFAAESALEGTTQILNTEVVRDKPISGIQDINDMESALAERGITGDITIITWKRFEEESSPASAS